MVGLRTPTRKLHFRYVVGGPALLPLSGPSQSVCLGAFSLPRPRRSLFIIRSACRDVPVAINNYTTESHSLQNGRTTHWYPHPSNTTHNHADTDIIVLDGGTGFLKVGYAAQVCPSRRPCITTSR